MVLGLRGLILDGKRGQCGNCWDESENCLQGKKKGMNPGRDLGS